MCKWGLFQLLNIYHLCQWFICLGTSFLEKKNHWIPVMHLQSVMSNPFQDSYKLSICVYRHFPSEHVQFNT